MPDYHGWTHVSKARGGTDPVDILNPVYCIKVFDDFEVVRTGNKMFAFFPDEDVDGFLLTKVEMYVTNHSSSGIVQCQIRRGESPGTDVLSTRIQVDATELHSSTASTVYVIDDSVATVAWPEMWSIDVDSSGTAAQGLGIHLSFS